MRRILTGSFLLVTLAGCALLRGGPPRLTEGLQQLYIDGVRFSIAADPEGWYVEHQDFYSVAIVKPARSQDETIALSAELFHAPAPEPGKDLVQQIREAEEKDAPPPRYALKVHELTAVTLGKAQCVRSHSIAEDHSPTVQGGKTGSTMLLELLSLSCIHPDDPRVAFTIGYSDRYYPGNGDPEFMQKGMGILGSAEITKLQD